MLVHYSNGDPLAAAAPKTDERKFRLRAAAIGTVVSLVLLLSGGSISLRPSGLFTARNLQFLGDKGTTEPPTNDIDDTFIYAGCYVSEQSLDTYTVSGNNRAIQCREKCPLARFFGVAETVCSCFVIIPTQSLAFGSCASPGIDDTQERMELYFNVAVDITCGSERTEAVRNFLTEEGDAPFGFDIVSNTFLDSPFLFYKEKCGTNIYEVRAVGITFYFISPF
jgi:hypothetical protein